VKSSLVFSDPTILQETFNSFVFGGFTSFVLIIIKCLDTRFFTQTLIFFSILLIVEIAYPILYNRWEVVPHGLVLFVNAARFPLYAAFVVWFAMMCQKLDQTEQFKFNT
jgi:hypothetical protein